MQTVDEPMTTDQQSPEMDEKEILKQQANRNWAPPKDDEKRVRLTVTKIDQSDKSKDFFVSVNFRDYLIKYDEPVDVPVSVVEALKNTAITTMVQDPHTEKLTPAKRARFAYSVEPI